MIEVNFDEKQISGNLLTEFGVYDTSVYSAKLSNADDEIVAFCVEFNDQIAMEQNWSRINNAIAADFQSTLNSDFSAWNIYLVIWCKQKASKSIKYKVENDKAFIRKLVIDNCEKPSDFSVITHFLDNLLLGKDLLQAVSREYVENKPYKLSKFTRSIIDLESDNTDLLNIWQSYDS